MTASLTIGAAAAAAGIHRRTLTAYFAEGAPRWHAGEAVSAWLPRFRAWRRQRARHKPGRELKRDRLSREAGEGDLGAQQAIDWEARSSQALAMTRIFDLEVKRGKFLPREEVQREWTRRVLAVKAALMSWPRSWARRLYQAPSPEWIEEQLLEGVTDLLHDFARPSIATPTPADALDPEPPPDPTEPEES